MKEKELYWNIFLTVGAFCQFAEEIMLKTTQKQVFLTLPLVWKPELDRIR